MIEVSKHVYYPKMKCNHNISYEFNGKTEPIYYPKTACNHNKEATLKKYRDLFIILKCNVITTSGLEPLTLALLFIILQLNVILKKNIFILIFFKM